MSDRSSEPGRIVTDSMLGMRLPDAATWSPLVSMALGQNPGPFTGPGTNVYIIGSGSRPLLLDTGDGTAAFFPVFERACRETRPLEGFQAVVLTHGHPDHIGGVTGIQERYGPLPVLKMPRPGTDPAGVVLERLTDGDVITSEGATLRAIATPGHACDHLCFYLEEERALFTGDVVLGAGTTVIPDDGDLGDYMTSLRRLLALDVAVIYPAHGPAILAPHEKIDQYIAHRELRERQVLACLGEGMGETTLIVKRLYADVPELLHGAAAMSVRAHLRKLERDGVAGHDGARWFLSPRSGQ